MRLLLGQVVPHRLTYVYHKTILNVKLNLPISSLILDGTNMLDHFEADL